MCIRDSTIAANANLTSQGAYLHDAEKLAVVNVWDIGSNYDISLADISSPSHMTDSDRAEIKENYNNLITLSEQGAYQLKDEELVKSNLNHQQKLNTLLNLQATSNNEWADSDYRYAQYANTMIRELSNIEPSADRDISLALHGVNKPKKENDNMATQSVGDIVKIDTGASENKSEETAVAVAPSTPIEEAPPAPAAEVSEPRVAELVQKTGEAILQEADTQPSQATPESTDQSEQIAEMKAELGKYKEQLSLIHI